MASLELPSIGTRLSYSGHLGTVRFVGPVDGTQGVWLGVEWDDPKRGKHDGVKDGKRYFSCLVPNSGSFIRPSPAVSYGVSFLSALTAKYIDVPHGDTATEKIVLGSSNGAIEVEAVGLDKIRGKLARLERLREVSLDGECVSKADLPGEIERTCPGKCAQLLRDILRVVSEQRFEDISTSGNYPQANPRRLCKVTALVKNSLAQELR